jgi:hypothetical protein
MALSDERLDAIRQADSGALNFVTLRQFRAIARAIEAEAWRDALTEAERICDYYATALDGGANEYTRSRECLQAANAIRALKDSQPPTA